jgi:hypothetical protein
MPVHEYSCVCLCVTRKQSHACQCRYMVIYWRGGVYADADCTCKMPILRWEPAGSAVPCSFYAGMENNDHIEQVCA